MNPFLYPKTRHVRRLRPGPFASHRAYKPHLRQEFGNQCVYCRMPDTMRGEESFGVDHYRPRSRFPALASEYGNLYYACNPCNAHKRDYWPVFGREDVDFVPNPCDHEMFRHLRFHEERVEARSHAGEIAEKLLDLNDPRVVAYRRFVLDLIATLELKEAEVLRLLGAMRARIIEGVKDAELDSDVARVESELESVRINLARLCGRSGV